MKNSARFMAYDILMGMEKEDTFSHVALQGYLKNKTVSDVDRRFIGKIVNGVLENKLLLDYWIRKLSNVRFGKLDTRLITIMRMGLYQLAFMDRVPESASVNESVILAKKVRQDYGNFINGVLRSFIRQGKWIDPPDEKRHPQTHLSIMYSHPEWLVEKWLNEFGFAFTKALLKANNESAPLSLRVNTLKISRDSLLQRFQDENIDAHASVLSPEGILLKHMGNNAFDALPGYHEGLFIAQDESSMCVAAYSGVKPGSRVLDVCAAPGGKSTHMAQLMKDEGHVFARDLQPSKIKIMDENIKRLGLKSVETQCYDALELDDALVGKIDVVLVDAPCSGLGIIRKKPDIKYNKHPEDLESLVKLQHDILQVASHYVAPEGILMYSTCTINPSENDDVVWQFLKDNRQFQLIPLTESPVVNTSGTVTLYPHIHGTDGFYIAKLKRCE